ncbi:hypothetical protein [Streptomyces sp. NRRL_B-2557]|uniref:hypothetical protein n=1 Tax=Streptomyces sp. NRRL_B-2557 TaxID=3028698 RepID=UPI0029A3AF94|nr:hypothetical protein [Streptomyces sp. NRRL_B-2557]MDX2748535.1 hypothetical protein [Streptomyces sp. NRRL_B-2557]
MTETTQSALCYCGCRTTIGYGRTFAAGHDKIAEAAYMAVHHNGSVAELLISQGYGPDNPVTDAAVATGKWKKCEHCDYKGAPESIRNHMAKVQKAETNQRESLEKSLRSLGGTWDPSRGMQTLRDAGYHPSEKYIREVYRRLVDSGLLEKVDENRAIYFVTEQ